jgi:two-component system sensor histidine kinase/response regulator
VPPTRDPLPGAPAQPDTTATPDLRRLQAALSHSEAFYHSLVESLPGNILRKDLQGRFTFVNTRFCQTVGHPREAVIGKTDFDLFPAELAAQYQAADEEVIRTGRTHENVEEHHTAGGTMYVQVIKTPIRDDAGRIIGTQGIFWDVTERRRMEDALHEERALLRALLDTVPDSIYFKDRDSRFLRVSAALARRVGVDDPADVIGRTDADLFAPEHATAALADEQRIMATGQAVIGKVEQETWIDGRESWVSTTKVPMRNARGAVVGTLGVTRDVTEIKRAETELALARDAALESARFKAEFLANMSHEIRTPLNAIVGMTGLLLETSLDAEQRDFTETVRGSADLLLDIVNDVLDFSKLEAGKMHIEQTNFDLSQVIEESADLLAERAQAKGLELLTAIPPHAPRRLMGDPSRLRQVLVNLVGNAVKFTEQGEVVISVSIEDADPRRVKLRFSVRDTGIGIAPDAQARLFNAFTQADGSTTRKYGGTGLGLAICRQLVELMGGTIELTSEPGRGSTFSFTLTLARQPWIAATPTPAPDSLKGVRVLIVDDNDTNRRILHHQFEAWGMRNDSAASGPAALALLKRAAETGDPYRTMVLDMQMPDMDGAAVARAVKADPQLADTRIVILTSLAFHPDEADFRSLGISAYLTKPVKQSRLMDCLADVLHAAPAVVHLPGTPQQPATEAAPARSLRILLAEDNAVNQKVALRQLAKLGYSADAVADGDEAVRAVQSAPYDVILMDCQMPRLDGYAATRRIRDMEGRTPGMRRHHIIALTANSMSGDREKCLQAGMNAYVSKPVRREELAAALEAVGTLTSSTSRP